MNRIGRALFLIITAILFAACGAGDTPEGPPQITNDNLADGKGVSLLPQIAFTFNKNIDEKRTTAENFFLYDSNGSRIDTTSVASAKVAAFEPSEELDYNSTYSFQVKNILDKTGTKMKGTYSKSFTTTGFIKSITPADADTNISVFSDIIIEFGSIIDPSTFEITISGLTFAEPESADNKTFVITPTGGTDYSTIYSGMNPSTEFNVTISNAVDIYDNNISYIHSTLFTTIPPDTTAPLVLNTSPVDLSKNIAADTNITIVFDEDIIEPDESNFSIIDDTLASINFTLSYDTATKTAILNPVVNIDYAREYTVNIYNISDVFTNILAAESITFTTSTILKSVFPAEGDASIPVDSILTAVFEGKIDSTMADFTLKDDAGNLISGSKVFGPTTATFTPAANLGFLKEYSAKITGIKDTYGNTLADQDWSFTAKNDDIKPVIVLVEPSNQQTSVAINSAVRATYDEYIAGKIEFSIQDSAGSSVAGTADVNGTTVTFTSAAGLDSSENYTVVLSGVEDLLGNKAQTYIWSFVTVAQ